MTAPTVAGGDWSQPDRVLEAQWACVALDDLTRRSPIRRPAVAGREPAGLDNRPSERPQCERVPEVRWVTAVFDDVFDDVKRHPAICPAAADCEPKALDNRPSEWPHRERAKLEAP